MKPAAPHAASHFRIAAVLLIFALLGPPVGAVALVISFDSIAQGGLTRARLAHDLAFLITGLVPAVVYFLGTIPAIVTGGVLCLAASLGRLPAVLAAMIAGIFSSVATVPILLGFDSMASVTVVPIAAAGLVASIVCSLPALLLLPAPRRIPSPARPDP